MNIFFFTVYHNVFLPSLIMS